MFFMMKNNVFITVDMETPQTPYRMKKISNPLFNEKWEYLTILKICHFYGIPVTFFLNIYEEQAWGEGYFTDIADNIYNLGGDIQLHTHPFWAYDYNRINMHEYSKDEQSDIIGYGKERLRRMSDGGIKIHRAGAYGADLNTMTALRENGIPLDSSFFWNHINCKLNGTGKRELINTGIQQVEITTFARTLKYDTSVIKLDVDWMDLNTLLTAIDKIHKSRRNNITLFLHSSSFMKWNKYFTKYDVDYYKIFKFIIAIEAFMKKGYYFMKIRDVPPNNIANSWKHSSCKIGKIRYYNQSYSDLNFLNMENVTDLGNQLNKRKKEFMRIHVKDTVFDISRDFTMSHNIPYKIHKYLG